jgi:hypothetical protein
MPVGSSLVLDVAGHVLSNAHVVQHAAKVTVQPPDWRDGQQRIDVGDDSRACARAGVT